jgi:hypothetical protein
MAGSAFTFRVSSPKTWPWLHIAYYHLNFALYRKSPKQNYINQITQIFQNLYYCIIGYSHCALSYIQYIHQQMHLTKFNTFTSQCTLQNPIHSPTNALNKIQYIHQQMHLTKYNKTRVINCFLKCILLYFFKSICRSVCSIPNLNLNGCPFPSIWWFRMASSLVGP